MSPRFSARAVVLFAASSLLIGCLGDEGELYRMALKLDGLSYDGLSEKDRAEATRSMVGADEGGDTVCIAGQGNRGWKDWIVASVPMMASECRETGRSETDTAIEIAFRCGGADAGDLFNVKASGKQTADGFIMKSGFDYANADYGEAGAMRFTATATRIGTCRAQ